MFQFSATNNQENASRSQLYTIATDPRRMHVRNVNSQRRANMCYLYKKASVQPLPMLLPGPVGFLCLSCALQSPLWHAEARKMITTYLFDLLIESQVSGNITAVKA